MLSHIGSLTIQVTDQDKALEYYTKKLGFELRSDQPMGPGQRWVEVGLPGSATTLVLYKATPDMPGASSYDAANASIGKPTSIILESEDIVATFAAFKASGVTILREPIRESWGWWGEIADGDGNSYGVHQ